MSRRKAGLQKEFSAIFEGVWIPAGARVRGASPSPAAKEEPAPQVGKIEEAIARARCSRNFECYSSGFEKLCKVKLVGDGKLLECLPENRHACELRFSFGGRSFCKCEVRYLIAKDLGK